MKTNIVYETILQEAELAADAAASKWLKEAQARGPAFSVHEGSLFGGATGPAIGYLLDVCGNAFIKIRDARKRFPKYLLEKKKADYVKRTGRKPYPGSIGAYWSIHHCLSGRQEMGLNIAAAEAFMSVLRKHDVADGLYVHSYID